MATTLKTLDTNVKIFTANGVTYHIEPSMSIARFEVYQKLEIEAGYSITFKTLFSYLRELYDLMNNMKFVDASYLLLNILNGLANIDNKEIPALQFCTLFINASDEDRTVYDTRVMQQKIDNWKAEGIDVSFFLSLSVSLINGFTEAYSQVSQSTLNVQKETVQE